MLQTPKNKLLDKHSYIPYTKTVTRVSKNAYETNKTNNQPGCC